MNGLEKDFGRRPLPRPSRLPRAAASTIADTQHQDDGTRAPYPSKPSAVSTLRTKPSGNLRENGGQLASSRFGWHPQSIPTSTRPSTAVAADTTVPYANGSSTDSDTSYGIDSASSPSAEPSISTFDQNRLGVDRKKSRPSLSERTIETLSQIPPSPSPSRRKSSITAIMAPPPRPPSSLSSGGGPSPHSPSMRPPIWLEPPAKAPSALARAPANGIRTPSKTPGKEASRVGKFTSPAPRTVSIVDSGQKLSPAPKPALSAHKVKSLHDLRAASTRQPTRKVSLNFRDTPVTPTSEVKSLTRLGQQNANTSGLKSRTLAQTTTTNGVSRLKKRPSYAAVRTASTELTNPDEQRRSSNGTGLKSSAALRETIAKAKAMKRQVATQPKITNDLDLTDDNTFTNGTSENGLSAASLKRRVISAVTAGTLNVAALGLKQVPNEILKMYDAGENGNINWSEAVDLVKLNLADNEIDDLPDSVFPDWSVEELTNDDEKSNMFSALEVLNVRGNRLLSLPIGLRRLSMLHTLNLSNNRLTLAALDVICQIPSLRDLSLANNEMVGALPASFSQLRNLHTLDIHDNRLSDLGTAFNGLENLQKLNVSGNTLFTLPIKDLQDAPITQLDASRNKLEGTLLEHDFKDFPKLQELNLSGNLLAGICNGSLLLPSLQSLIVDDNQIEVFPDVAGLESLTTLTASGNRLEEVPEAFVKLKNLRSANFGGNNIRLLDPYISRMDNLTVLNLAGNPLRDRKYLSMSTSDLKVELAKRLTAVLVQTDLPSATAQDFGSDASVEVRDSTDALFQPERGVLDLASRNLRSIEPSQVDLSSSVHTIRLSNNQMTYLPIDLLIHPSVQPSLKRLDISHNLSLDATDYLPHPIYLPSLETLTVSTTSVSSLESLTDNLSAPSLTELNISHHRLTGAIPHLKFSFPNLITLLATDNAFTSISVDAISGLEIVDVRNNDIDSLPPKIGELGNFTPDRKEPGRLRIFEVSGNKFRVPRLVVVEKGTEAILADLRRMVNIDDVGDEWRE